MSDEHDTTGARERPDLSAEMVARIAEETRRNLLRLKHLNEMVLDPADPEVGLTPREEIYRKNKARLWRYQSARTRRTPLLFVPNLGISRPYIFDLMPRASFIEYMTGQGFDFYLLDWASSDPRTTGSRSRTRSRRSSPGWRARPSSRRERRRCPCWATAWARPCPRAS